MNILRDTTPWEGDPLPPDNPTVFVEGYFKMMVNGVEVGRVDAMFDLRHIDPPARNKIIEYLQHTGREFNFNDLKIGGSRG